MAVHQERSLANRNLVSVHAWLHRAVSVFRRESCDQGELSCGLKRILPESRTELGHIRLELGSGALGAGDPFETKMATIETCPGSEKGHVYHLAIRCKVTRAGPHLYETDNPNRSKF